MVLQNSKDSIYQTLLDFCAVRSVTDSEGEVAAAKFLHQKLGALPYFKQHPDDLFLQEITRDRLNRLNCVAWVRAKKPTKRTIILMGHFDVVDTDVCGHLRDDAFSPERYTELMKAEVIGEEARADLLSDEWIFGRGTADMKCGLVVQAALLAELSEKTADLEANFLYLAVADEENNACGIHQAIHYLHDLKKEGYQFVCCIDSEPTITQEDKGKGWIHLGSVGMYTPFTFVLGRETHVGEYFEGIPASSIAFKLGALLEGSEEYADTFKGVTYPPLTCLEIKDYKPTYSVTVIERISMYHNVLFVTKTPDEVLASLRAASRRALDEALTEHHRKRSAQQSHTNPVHFDSAVMNYQELVSLAEETTRKSIQQISTAFLSTLPKSLELQDRGLRLVNHLIDITGVKGPKIIIGFLTPYCPALYNERKTTDELLILNSAQDLVQAAKTTFNTDVRIGEIYEGISDLSELGFKGTTQDIKALSENFASWGVDFDYPFDISIALGIPVVNVGPIGKDAHKKTERLHIQYATEVFPFLLKRMVTNLMK